MKFPLCFAAAVLISQVQAQTPKIFDGLLKPGIPVRGQIGMVLPPKEIDKYVAKVELAARKDPAWFKEFSAKSKPGIPLPFDERLGLTQTEYDEYLALWAKREFKPTQEVMVMIRKSASDHWTFTATGDAAVLSTLRYDSKADQFLSPNGTLKRIDDIKAEATSLLGAWSGAEWKFEEETSLGKTKENFAIGKFADNKFGILVYRAQEVSSSGTRTLDKSLVVRFVLGPAGHLKLVPRTKSATAPAPSR